VFKSLTVILILLSITVPSYAQRFDFFTEEAYIRNPNHIEFGFGTSNFLGDLGGKDKVGTNGLQDLEFTEFNAAAFIGFRHAFHKNLYGRFDINYGRVSGADKLTKENFRENRNLQFRSDIFEFNLMAETWIRIGGKKGHQYKLQRRDTKESPWHVRGSYLTFFGGIGGFHFNPKAPIQGQWVPLAPLSTEGQGLPGGPEKYKLWQMNIPVGTSFMFRLHRQWSFGIEVTYRFTFTDYIDDVSGIYYNPSDLLLYQDPLTADVAVYFSNPALGAQNLGVGNYATRTGEQRGDPKDNDGYFYALIKADYLIINEAKFSKKKTRKMGSYRKHRRPNRLTI